MHFSQELFAFIATYGYFAVFLGSIVEGETVILLGGLLGQQTNLSFPLILVCAFFGAITGDIGWFLVGKYAGHQLLSRLPFLARLMKTPVGLARRKPRVISLFVRFMYGFRTITPFSLGMSGLRARIFILWNAMGALIWVAVFGGAGFALGAVLESFFGKIHRFELVLIVVVLLGFAIFHTLTNVAKNKLKKVAAEGVNTEAV